MNIAQWFSKHPFPTAVLWIVYLAVLSTVEFLPVEVVSWFLVGVLSMVLIDGWAASRRAVDLEDELCEEIIRLQGVIYDNLYGKEVSK